MLFWFLSENREKFSSVINTLSVKYHREGLRRQSISTPGLMLALVWLLDFFLLLPYLALTLVCRKMAWIRIIRIIFYIYMVTQDHAIYHVWIHFSPTRWVKKNIWPDLESNQGPLASQATALTTRPRLSVNTGEISSRETNPVLLTKTR